MEKVIFQPNKQGHQQSSPNFKRFTKKVTVNGEGEREREATSSHHKTETDLTMIQAPKINKI